MKNKPIPRRAYTSEIELSILGMGAIVLMGQEQAAANREVARAVERGINYYDVAPVYGKGEAEEKLGPALAPYRDEVFLACKTHLRSGKRARTSLENSLRILQTDYFDLFQFHNLSQKEEVEEVFAPGGAMEVVLEAQKAGKIRHIGFSCHREDTALDLLDRFEWDSVLFPLNCVCMLNGDFGNRLLAKAKAKGVARLALKALAQTPWENSESRAKVSSKCWYRPVQDEELADLSLRYTLGLDITSAVAPGDEHVYRLAENLVSEFKPLTPTEEARLWELIKDVEPIFRSEKV
jgi:aryl-alcohol dehydrogenase-like predicted oxidoreductase